MSQEEEEEEQHGSSFMNILSYLKKQQGDHEATTASTTTTTTTTTHPVVVAIKPEPVAPDCWDPLLNRDLELMDEKVDMMMEKGVVGGEKEAYGQVSGSSSSSSSSNGSNDQAYFHMSYRSWRSI